MGWEPLMGCKEIIKKPPSFDEGFFESGAGKETRTPDPTLAIVTDIKYLELHKLYFNKFYI